jgi:acylphosphatase
VLRHARALGLTGFVANRHDGRVEVVAEGPRDDLDRLLAELREGPGASVVQAVDVEWGTATGQFGRFDVTF